MSRKLGMPNEINDLVAEQAEGMGQVMCDGQRDTLYSLAQDLSAKKKEIFVLEKKITLANGLLAKVNNDEQTCKLVKEKQGFDERKVNLAESITELACIIESIKDCWSLYVFVGSFYKLVIEKENFEQPDKSLTSQLIYKLKDEENNLYDIFIKGDYFSKAMKALSFEPYQYYFKKYTTDFFSDIQSSSDPHRQFILPLTTIFYEFSHIRKDRFNPADLDFFLKENIPDYPLPSAQHKLVGLRCFFFYNILLEYLRLKPVSLNFEHLKKTVQFESYLVNFRSPIKENLVDNLHVLEKNLTKKEKKLNIFFENKSENTDEDLNKALIFYNKLEDELQNINKKTENLLKNKDISLTKMRYVLAETAKEHELARLIAVFSSKISHDFYLYAATPIEDIKTNKEALNYLLYAIQDKPNIILNNEANLFINSIMEQDQDIATVSLEDLNLDDWINFSHFYIFSLIYTDFNARLTGFNNKLLFTEVLTFNIFLMAKIEVVSSLKHKIMKEINKFFGDKHINQSTYTSIKKNLLEEVRLILELIQHTTQVLKDTKVLESVLIPKIKANSFLPRPDENNLLESLKNLQDEKEFFQLKYEAIRKHIFPVKAKKSAKKPNIKLADSLANNSEEKYSKFIEYFFDPLNCLSENLSESLKCLEEIEKNAISVKKNSAFRQKISSAVGQISSSIDKIVLSLTVWLEADESEKLANLNLSQLLEKIDAIIVSSALIKKGGINNKTILLQYIISSASLSTSLLLKKVVEMIDKYLMCNEQAKNLLQIISRFFIGDANAPLFFSKSIPRKLKHQLDKKLANNYLNLKEQFIYLEKLIRSMKYDAHERIIQLYSLVGEGEDYQKACNLLKDKMSLLKILPSEANIKFKKANKDLVLEKTNLAEDRDNRDICSYLKSEESVENRVVFGDLNESQLQVPNIIVDAFPEYAENLMTSENVNNLQEASVSNENSVDATIAMASSVNKTSFNQANILNKIILDEYENWNIEFEKWKYEKNLKLYKLFHVIESCSMSVLMNTANAFLKYLSFYEREFVEKKSELIAQKEQIISFFEKSDKITILINYLCQHEKWLDSVFHRIAICRAIIHQNDNEAVTAEFPRLPSLLADNRAEFNSLLAFYLGSADKYNKFRDDLAFEEGKLYDLNRNFVKKIITIGSLEGAESEGNVLSEFSEQMDKVNQLKLAIEQEYENKKRIKAKLVSIANPEIVKFYLSRIDPCDAETIKANTKSNLLPIKPAHIPPPAPPEFNTYMAAAPNAFYSMPQATTHLIPNFAPVPYCGMCYPNSS